MVTINGNTYSLQALSLIDSWVLNKNGKAVWLIPNEIVHDVNEILAYAKAAAKFLEKNPPPDDSQKVNILSGTKTE